MKNSSAQALRQSLRASALASRAALATTRLGELSEAVCTHLQRHFPRAPAPTIGFCWPIRQEPDLRPLIAVWRAQGATAALPVTDTTRKLLSFRAWTPETPMLEAQYGIPVPAEGATTVPECLLIPMLAFDAAGYRLGYGAGWFDRTLANWQPRPLLIGVAFELGRIESIAPQAHDVPVDWIATEAGVFKANPTRGR